MNANYSSVKWALYALVVLLNLNVLMVTFGESSSPTHAAYGYNQVLETAGTAQGRKVALSLTITMVLGILNFCGYSTVVIFLACAEVPNLVNFTDKTVAKAIAAPNYKPHLGDGRNPSAFVTWALAMGALALFVVMHSSNYKLETAALDEEVLV
jgi:hypothetical protein